MFGMTLGHPVKKTNVLAGILVGSCALSMARTAEAATVYDSRVDAVYTDSASPYGTHQATITLGSGAKLFVTIPSDNPLSKFYVSFSDTGSPDTSVFRLFNPLSRVSRFVGSQPAVAETGVLPPELDASPVNDVESLDDAKKVPPDLLTPSSGDSQSSGSIDTVVNLSPTLGTISEVPLPSSLPLFAAALLAVGTIGYGLGAKQRSRVLTKAVD